ncbi:hypothetical protein TorRG33x02_301570, partial [Trema orientale]
RHTKSIHIRNSYAKPQNTYPLAVLQHLLSFYLLLFFQALNETKGDNFLEILLSPSFVLVFKPQNKYYQFDEIFFYQESP